MLSSAAARTIAIVLFFIVISFIKINSSTIAPTRSDNIVFQYIVGELYTARIIVVRLLQKYNAQNQARCRLATNKQIPALTETFKLSTRPSIGMRTSSSQVSRVRRRSPSPSALSTQASGPLYLKPCKSCSASPTAPATCFTAGYGLNRAGAVSDIIGPQDIKV